jgi:hypothetical protein
MKRKTKGRPMPKEPHSFSRIAEELVGDFRGVPFDEPRKSRKRPTVPLLGLIESILTEHQIGRDSAEHTIRAQWPALVGAANASYSHAVRVEREKQLVIHVTHPVVRNELFMHSEEIVARIRKLPGCSGIKQINLRAG